MRLLQWGMKQSVTGWFRGYKCNRCGHLFPRFTMLGEDRCEHWLCNPCGAPPEEWTQMALSKIETEYWFRSGTVEYVAKPLRESDESKGEP